MSDSFLLHPLLQLGGVGVAILFLWWVVKQQLAYMGKQLDVFREELAAQRKQCHEENLETRASLAELTRSIKELVEKVGS